MMRLQRQFNGQTITLDTRNQIGGGGQGRIYGIVEDFSLVAKIYHHPTDEDADKLTVMYNYPPANTLVMPGVTSIAWPVDLLHTTDSQRKIVGYLMPRVIKTSPIHTFYTPKTRREQKPLFNYLYLHRTARNLVASVADLHSSGYVIGDINESNILVTDTALVTLVDTDSFQVNDPDTGMIYRCPVGKVEFTPPELQGQAFRELNRTPEQDRFGLAVLIFQLLMEGTHPFSGVYQGKGDPPTMEARIRAGHFVYGTRSVPYQPMPLAPAFEILHPRLQQLFIQCFEEGFRNPQARPDARTWLMALKDAEAALITCDKLSQHRYGNHLKSCPWCDRSVKLGGRDPFPSRVAVQQGQHLQPLKVKRPRFLAGGKPKTKTASKRPVTPQYPVKSKNPRILMPTQGKMWQWPTFKPQVLLWNLTQGIILGGIWGASCLSAIIAIILATLQNQQGIWGALVIGSMWGGFLGMGISVFLPPPRGLNKGVALIVGIFSGAFIAATISGVIFGAMSREVVVGQGIFWGGFMGMVWGSVWHIFKPPLSLPTSGYLRGRVGAILGGTWGSFVGTLAGVILGAGLVLSQELPLEITQLDEFAFRLLVTVIVGAGLGAMGGIVSGTLFGTLGGAPQLPLSAHLYGRRGALIGGVWGNFLGVLAGGTLGAIATTISPQWLAASNTTPDIMPLVVGAIIICAGVGSIWGAISGFVWGGLGKF